MSIINLDADRDNEQWYLYEWRLPPYKSDDFFRYLAASDISLKDFRESFVYEAAGKSNLIINDDWKGGDNNISFKQKFPRPIDEQLIELSIEELTAKFEEGNLSSADMQYIVTELEVTVDAIASEDSSLASLVQYVLLDNTTMLEDARQSIEFSVDHALDITERVRRMRKVAMKYSLWSNDVEAKFQEAIK